MANATLVNTPGVYFTELDLSQYIANLSDTILGLVITATKGPTDTLTLCTTRTQFETFFGLEDDLHPGTLVAREFFNAGGNTAWVVRIANGDATASASITLIGSGSPGTLTANETGTFFDQLSFPISYGGQLAGTLGSTAKTLTSGTNSITMSLASVPVVPNTLRLSLTGTGTIATDDGAGNLVFNSNASTYSAGTINYATGAIAFTISGASASTIHYTATFNYFSTFTLQTQITVQNQSDVTIRIKVLETFYGLTLDNMVATLAGSQYLAPVSAFGSFPVAGVYDMSGGDDGIDDLTDANYIGDTIGGTSDGLQLFGTGVAVNEVMVPGVSSAGVRQALIELANQRQDIMTPLDPPSDTTVQTVADWANATGAYSAYGVVDSNYASIYFPWYTATNPNTGDIDQMPPTAAIAQVLAGIDFWQAPAGPKMGLLQNCLDTNVHLSLGDRQFLGANRINPIGNLNGLGIQILGQKTATLIASSLDRVGARRMLLRVEKSITTALYALLFQPNEQSTWNQAVALVQPYLNTLAAQGKIYGAQFYCDSKTNIPQYVNNNQMTAVCVIAPLKFAEQIVVTFEITEFGVAINEDLIAGSLIGQ
jgi:hypothetical protein